VPTYFLPRNFSYCSPDHGSQDGALALVGKLDGFFGRLELVLEESAFLRVRDMHVFKADIAAIGGTQRVVELAHGDPFEAEYAADIDLAVELAVETVPFERQVLGHLPMGEAQRVEIGCQVPAHAVEPHQQHRTDAVVRRFLQRLGIGGLSGLFRRLSDRDAHLRGVERGGEIRLAVDHFGQPARVAPAGALLRAFLIAHLGQEIVALVTHRSIHVPQRRLGPPSGWRDLEEQSEIVPGRVHLGDPFDLPVARPCLHPSLGFASIAIFSNCSNQTSR